MNIPVLKLKEGEIRFDLPLKLRKSFVVSDQEPDISTSVPDIFKKIELIQGKYFWGYANVEQVDMQGDLFPISTLEELAPGLTEAPYNKVFLFHNYEDIAIGTIIATATDSRGLLILAKLNEDHSRAQEVWKSILNGSLDGFSMGGSFVEVESQYNEKLDMMVSIAKKAIVSEVSLTSIPVNGGSLLQGAFQKAQKRYIEEFGKIFTKGQKVPDLTEKKEGNEFQKPFAGYKDFKVCVSKNGNKKNPQGYCAAIMRKVEKSMEESEEFSKGGPGSGPRPGQQSSPGSDSISSLKVKSKDFNLKKDELDEPNSANKELDTAFKQQYGDKIPLFHETSINNLESIKKNGLTNEANFATVGEPSDFITSKEKLIVKFNIDNTSHERESIAPDMRYDPENPAKDLLLEHKGVQGADVSYESEVKPNQIDYIAVVKDGKVVKKVNPLDNSANQMKKSLEIQKIDNSGNDENFKYNKSQENSMDTSKFSKEQKNIFDKMVSEGKSPEDAYKEVMAQQKQEASESVDQDLTGNDSKKKAIKKAVDSETEENSEPKESESKENSEDKTSTETEEKPKEEIKEKPEEKPEEVDYKEEYQKAMKENVSLKEKLAGFEKSVSEKPIRKSVKNPEEPVPEVSNSTPVKDHSFIGWLKK